MRNLIRKFLHLKFINPISSAVSLRLPTALSSPFYSAFGTHADDRRQPFFVKAFAHVATTGLQGDYLEFGVSEGHSLIMAYRAANLCQLKGMRMFGFDSFQGLPESEGSFVKGVYKSSKANTIRHLRRRKVDTKGLVLVEGLFHKSLNETVKALHNLQHAAIIHIDCDIYSATKAVLPFVEDLVHPGTVIIFDDWHGFDGEESPEEFGEQRAFLEWPLHTRFKVFYDPITVRGKAFVMEP